MFKDPQVMPEIVNDAEHYINYAISYTYISMTKFNLQIKHSKWLTITNAKIKHYNHKFTWTQILQYYDSHSVNQFDY